MNLVKYHIVISAAASFAKKIAEVGKSEKFARYFKKERPRLLAKWGPKGLGKEIDRVIKSVAHRATSHDGKLSVYRCLAVNSLEDFKENPYANRGGVGVFWSYTKDGAQCYWRHLNAAEDATELVLIGEVDESTIDWNETLALNLVNKLEREIRLHSKGKVHVKALLQGKKKIDYDETLSA